MPKPPPSKSFPYMTFIPNRSPKWKAHTNLGHVKNAIQQKIGYHTYRAEVSMEVHKWNSEANDWEVLWEIPFGTPYAELPWVNTPEVKAKQEIERRKVQLEKLQRFFVSMKDAERLKKVWDANPNRELEEQLGFAPEEYLK